ncbi:DarT ssDNA thymidine ADP-ribosyltransferase family protein, partial [Clostridium sp.]|uniref:DarT ssDNA thymidine ADP-ribosyltransferase family protein n=1 Tax=Clostridium sp. TaxID=1506 RepID=UPI00262B145C
MGLENTKNGILLYHLTKLDNLKSILEHGLLSRKIVKDNNIGFEDVADSKIITKRTKLGLDEYTPFHFHPYSAFDTSVKSNYEDEFIYICIKRGYARNNNFKILTKHPLSIEECVL